MIGNMIESSPNMFLLLPMKYFGVFHGLSLYADEVQGHKMTGSHNSPQGFGLQEYNYKQSSIILSHIFTIIKYPFSYS